MAQQHPVLTPEKLLHMVKTIEKTDNVELINQVVRPGTEKGENYASELSAVEVEAKVNGSAKKYQWMIKLPPMDKGRLMINEAMMLEKREIAFYNDLVPKFQDLIRAKGANIQLNFAPTPYTECKDDSDEPSILCMENLKAEGFSDPIDKKKGLTLDYCKLVVDELAKFHAVSYVFFKPEFKDNLQEGLKRNELYCRDFAFSDPPPIVKQMFDGMMGPMFKLHVTFLQACQDEGSSGFADAFNEYINDNGGDWNQIKNKGFIPEPNGFNTLTHGDVWFNNMLFKHVNNVPTKCCLVDVSIFRWSNPCTDLVYFFFSSTTADFREKHLDELLKQYHTTLSNSLQSLGEDPNVYPLKTLMADYHRKCPAGFLTSIFMLPGVLAKKEDAFSPEDVLGDWSNRDEAQKMADKIVEKAKLIFQNQPILKVFIKGNFLEMVRRGFFKL